MSGHHVSVKVESSYMPDQSDPANGHYVFIYHIVIRNDGDEPAKLLTRHWVITDAQSNVQEVHGIGVVGEQPHLEPGDFFEYSSGAILATPVGSMQGSYEMLTDNGALFTVEIPPFSLAVPDVLH